MSLHFIREVHLQLTGASAYSSADTINYVYKISLVTVGQTEALSRIHMFNSSLHMCTLRAARSCDIIYPTLFERTILSDPSAVHCRRLQWARVSATYLSYNSKHYHQQLQWIEQRIIRKYGFVGYDSACCVWIMRAEDLEIWRFLRAITRVNTLLFGAKKCLIANIDRAV